jgi:L-ascorbate metabolism protein UlaG (beta-lactamase superfamily)
MIGGMELQWYGQSAFRLFDGERTVFVDPFDDMSEMAGWGMRWDYPPIEGVTADLVLVTHEHLDHNGVGAIAGDPVVVRSAGTHESPVGAVVGIASEHDDAAGTQRGPNTLFVLDVGGMRVAHLGDLGQAALRDAQAVALGALDVLMVPVGGGPTIGADEAMAIVEATGARLVVPMHYQTQRVDWLEPLDAMAERFARVHRADTPTVDLDALAGERDGDGPLLVVPAAP